MARNLIAYFSRAGQNYVNGEIKNLDKGNTEVIAEYIQRAIGGEIFKIETVKEYPVDYRECTDVAKEELKQKARPELKSYLENLDPYEAIFLGYPIWYKFPPMAVATFLEHYDFTDKVIHPFVTHEGSEFGNSVSFMKRIVPKAKITGGFAVRGDKVLKAEAQLFKWIRSFR